MSSASVSNAGSDSDVVLIDYDDVSNYNPAHLLPQTPKTLAAIRAWLQPTAYDIPGGEYKKHLASHAPGTGAWLTSSPAYEQWLHGDEHGLLWLRGIPGSGKSVMAAKLIDEIKKAHLGCPVLFFFFRQIIDANHKPEALLRDWLDQLLEYSPPLQKALAGYVEGGQGVESVSTDDLWKELRMGFAQLPGKVFCVGDALDEMDRGDDAFLEALGALGQWKPAKVKVLITSRPVPTVEVPLRKAPCLRLRLEENLVDVDISTYVRHSFTNSDIPERDWKTIEHAVPGRANGLFLYAKLAMDAFLEPGAEIDDVLRHLPLDLNELYTGLLDEHAKRSGIEDAVQRLILQSVTHATRPLRLLELAEMIRVCSPSEPLLGVKAAKELIRSACGPLLEVLPDETVSVVHHSFTEYLKGTTRGDEPSGYRVLEKGPTNAELALACLEYLQAGCLQQAEMPRVSSADPWGRFTGENSQVSSEEARLRLQHPFFEYAVSNWHRHAVTSKSAGHDQGRIDAEIRRFLEGELLGKWLSFRWGAGCKGVTRVHVAARLGLVSHLKEMVGSMEADVPDEDGKTPLWWAAHAGSADSLRELIPAGANPDRDDSVEGLKPLHQAAQRNHGDTAKALLEAGVDPLTPRTKDYPGKKHHIRPSAKGHTPLMYACQGGHVDAVEAFLPFLTDEIPHRALAWAVEEGQSKVVALLLGQPRVDPNRKVNGDTMLYRACRSFDPGTISALLRAGADPNVGSVASGELEGQGSSQGSEKPEHYPLHRICGLDPNDRGLVRDTGVEEEVFSVLVEAGADVHRRGPKGCTPLHGAARSSVVLTRLLLDAGADANATDCEGRTPMHMRPTRDTMELLFELGQVDINQKDNDDRTPLHRMLRYPRFRKDDIPKLLEYGADCNAADDWGDTPLHTVMKEVDWAAPAVVPMLLAAGADPNARNIEGLTPLLLMDTNTQLFPALLNMLLDAGADVDAQDRKGATLLFRIMERGCCSMADEPLETDMKRLLDRGAKASVKDREGRTLLHRAVQTCVADAYKRANPYDKRIEFVLSLGIDLQVVDREGNGLLHEVALREENHHKQYAGDMTTLWKALSGMGLDLQLRNRAGRTPLHVLCAGYTAPSYYMNEIRPGDTLPIDFVLARMEDLEVKDHEGNTPLHLAVSTSQLYTKKLLDAGADPTAATFGGITPLHIAARDGRSNTIGLLLDVLRKRQPVEAGIPAPGVNTRLPRRSSSDTLRTPLHLACKSGRPESVRLLLDAGANLSDGNVFAACASFEPARVSSGDRNSDAMKPEKTARLEEILAMLLERGVDVSLLEVNASDGRLLEDALEVGGEYVAGCFADVRAKLIGEGLKPSYAPTGLSLTEYVRPRVAEASKQALGEFHAKAGMLKRPILHHLLVRREYHLVEELARVGAPFLPDWPGHFGLLVQNGYISLVDKIGTMEATAGLERGDWHAYRDPSRPGLWFAKRDLTDLRMGNPTPFILDAVRSELPNMDVLRLLVEKFAVDVSEVFRTPTTSSFRDRQESALHYIARGKAWWHVRQALPYLLDKGADLEARNGDGRTPLQVALAGGYPFSREAAETLVSAGADVNAGTEEGGSCLSCAWHDLPMLEVLISRGAAATPHALMAAISERNVPTLKILLSSPGTDPNACLERFPARGKPLFLRETPLLRAARSRSLAMGRGGGDSQNMRADVEMVRALLERGADPFARFQRRVIKRGKWAFKEACLAEEGEYVELTLLHHLLCNAWLVDAFLEIPSLDVNRRNAQGHTLLHVACTGYKGLDYIVGSGMGGEGVVSVYRRLRELGADVEARDNLGRTVLHNIAKLGGTRNMASLSCILSEAPRLNEQGDNQGQTPLHHAIRSSALGTARVLLDGGADIHAVDNDGNTILHVLLRNLQSSALRALFEELVSKGLPPNARNKRGETPLFAFALRPRGSTSLGPAYCHQTKEELTEDKALPLLKRLGVDFFAKDDGGRSALHVAAEGDVGRFRELQGLGLDGMAEDGSGRTAVDVAAACGNREILELFEKAE